MKFLLLALPLAAQVRLVAYDGNAPDDWVTANHVICWANDRFFAMLQTQRCCNFLNGAASTTPDVVCKSANDSYKDGWVSKFDSCCTGTPHWAETHAFCINGLCPSKTVVVDGKRVAVNGPNFDPTTTTTATTTSATTTSSTTTTTTTTSTSTSTSSITTTTSSASTTTFTISSMSESYSLKHGTATTGAYPIKTATTTDSYSEKTITTESYPTKIIAATDAYPVNTSSTPSEKYPVKATTLAKCDAKN